jgi:homoaconitase/3-isopropylmalate dehydratase large subunit
MNKMTTLFDKIWEKHIVAQEEDETLLYVDRCLIHEGSRHTFDTLHEQGLSVAHPDKVFAFSDHYIPTDPQIRAQGVAGIADPDIRNMVQLLIRNTDEYKIPRFGWGDDRQGILHVAGPELGLSQPGIVLVGADLHTRRMERSAICRSASAPRNDARRCDADDLAAPPGTLRIRIDGPLGFGVTAKDIILAVIAKIGIGGAIGYAIEYAGSTVTRMTMSERMTICNMSIEAGAKAGMIAPDDTTYEFLANRAFAPNGRAWDEALKYWRTLPSEAEAKFAKEVEIDAARVAPMVTWGTNPEQALPITERVPDPSRSKTSSAEPSTARPCRIWACTWHAAHRHRGRSGFHRFVHQQPHRRYSRRRGDRLDDGRSGVDRSRLGERQAPSGSRGPRSHLHRGRLRVAGRRLFALHGAQRRSVEAGRALRIDLEQEFSGTTRSRWANASDEPGDGRRCGDPRPSGRCAPIVGGEVTPCSRL